MDGTEEDGQRDRPRFAGPEHVPTLPDCPGIAAGASGAELAGSLSILLMDELPMAISSRPWSRHECLSFAAFAVALGTGLFFLTHPWYDPAPDVFTYIATARSLAAGDGYQYLGAPFGIRPPGFSLLIAPWVVDGVDFAGLNLLVGLFGVASVLALAALLRDRIGLRLALLVAACLWLNPGFRILSSQVMSDVPGTALIFGCLLLERLARRRGGIAFYAILGVAIGAAAYVRSLAVLLIPAAMLALALRAWPERRFRHALLHGRDENRHGAIRDHLWR